MLLIEVAGLKPAIIDIANQVAHFRVCTHVMFESISESKQNYDKVFASTVEKVELMICEKLDEVFLLEELKELVSFYCGSLVKKFIQTTIKEIELGITIEEFFQNSCEEILEEMDMKAQMLQFNKSDSLKN